MRVPLSVGDFLRRGALVYPERTAIVDEPGVPGGLGAVSYAELEARARGLAIGLDGMGVAAGDRVAIVSPNAARFQVAFFGVSGWGRVLVPINYRLNADDIRYIVDHSGSDGPARRLGVGRRPRRHRRRASDRPRRLRRRRAVRSRP